MIRVRVINNTRQFENFLNNASDETMDIIGMFGTGQAKLRCPVKFGHLRGSIKYQVISQSFQRILQIYTDMYYSIFVHEGTRYMRPRRFIYDAIVENIYQIKQIAEERFRRGM